MSEPEISASGELLYQRVLPVFAQDDQYGFFGRHLCDALMSMLQGIDQIVLDTTSHPGWTTILDPQVCPEKWLPWCAQIYGITFTPGMTVEERREAIAELAPQARATVLAIQRAARETLTGQKIVHVVERVEEKAYKLSITTIAGETPNPAATERAVLSQKAGGLVMVYAAEPEGEPLWDEATKTWNEVAEALEWTNVKEGDV